MEGRLRTSSYEKNGIRQYSTEIVANEVQFLGGGGQGGAQGGGSSSNQGQPPTEEAGGQHDPDDDIPF